jgi:hypothetical protein
MHQPARRCVLAVFAHPDDETAAAVGTLIHHASGDGHRAGCGAPPSLHVTPAPACRCAPPRRENWQGWGTKLLVIGTSPSSCTYKWKSTAPCFILPKPPVQSRFLWRDTVKHSAP